MSRFDEIEDQAAQWLAREDRGLKPSEQAAFEAWLGRATAHETVYLALKSEWDRARRLAELRKPAFHTRSVRNQWDSLGGIRSWAAAAVLLLCVGVGSYVFYKHIRAPADVLYVTEVGQRQNVRLADGTRIEINTNTRLRRKMAESGRVLVLDQGEAFFDVAHDPHRPFVVFAGNRRITDIGTQFSVRCDGNDVEVTVAEGKVRVGVPDAPDQGRPVEVGAGSVIIATPDRTLVVRESPQEIADRLSWRQGMLVFHYEKLAAAVSEFNRYTKKHIVVVGPAGNLRIGGRFRSDNVDVFTSLMRKGFGLKIEDTGTEVIVSK